MPSQDNYDCPTPSPSLIAASYSDAKRYNTNRFSRWLLVDVARQQLCLVRDSQLMRSWPISTALVGLNNRQDSQGTPAGVHRIHRKIGADAESGTIFSSRKPTGKIWSSTDPQDARDLILTRILTLEGLQEGVNRGPGIDSLQRYIYLHGTNHERDIGTPCSGGCVRLTNADICDVFDLVEEGDPVVIV